LDYRCLMWNRAGAGEWSLMDSFTFFRISTTSLLVVPDAFLASSPVFRGGFCARFRL